MEKSSAHNLRARLYPQHSMGVVFLTREGNAWLRGKISIYYREPAKQGATEPAGIFSSQEAISLPKIYSVGNVICSHLEMKMYFNLHQVEENQVGGPCINPGTSLSLPLAG